jgi:hypothetical protein
MLSAVKDEVRQPILPYMAQPLKLLTIDELADDPAQPRIASRGARSVHVDLLVPDLNMYWITIELGAGHEDDLGGGA